MSDDRSNPANPEEDFAALLAEYEPEHKSGRQRRREPQVGEEVRGKVVSIGREAAFVDLGGKADAMIELAELRDPEGQLTIAVGEELSARVVEVGGRDGCVVLRRMLGRGADGRADLEQAQAHGIPVEGMVTAVNKGGVEVQIFSVRAFCPISQLDTRHVEDASEFVGQRLRFRVTRCEESGRQLNVVVSRRALLEEAAEEQAIELRTRLAVGAVLKGRVTGIKDYGAFVDLGGIEGMLHVSELGFQRVDHPKDLLTVGQELEVQVIKVEKTGDARRPEKVSLSLKRLERDPWDEVARRFPEGARAKGTVVGLETYGAFVELAPGLEGLVHVSELGRGRRLRHAREAVKLGQALEVVVLEVDAPRRRLSLGTAEGDAAEGGDAASPSSSSSGGAPGFGTLGDLLGKHGRPR